MGEKPKHRPFLLTQNLLHMDKAIIDRLEYVEETYAGEMETWHDPVTDTYYHVPLTILRDWENCEKIYTENSNT